MREYIGPQIVSFIFPFIISLHIYGWGLPTVFQVFPINFLPEIFNAIIIYIAIACMHLLFKRRSGVGEERVGVGEGGEVRGQRGEEGGRGGESELVAQRTAWPLIFASS